VSGLQKQRLAAIGAGVLALVVLAGGYFVLLAPKRSKAADLQTKIASTQTQIAAAEAASSAPGASSQRVKIADLYRLSRAMPDGFDTSGVLLDLGRAAAAAGVSLQTITPGTPNPAPAGGYELLPIAVGFQGRYGQLTRLLATLRGLVSVHDGALAAGGRLFTVDSVGFTAGDAGLPQVKATLQLEAYVFAPTVAPVAVTPTDTTTTGTTTPAPPSGTSAAASNGGTG
jgi:Tfp pilus assembly protein PilO